MKQTPMSTNTAIDIAEGIIDAVNHEQYIQAWQILIDTGICWSLQGWFGRRATNLILEGECHPAK